MAFEPGKPCPVDDFRTHINAGLERQGHSPVWRPQGHVDLGADVARALRDHRRRCEAIHDINADRKKVGYDPLPVPVRPAWKICDQSTPPIHTPHTTHRNPSPLEPSWKPPWEAVPRSVRRCCYWMRQRARPIQRDRVRMCGFALRAGAQNVPVVVTDEGRARFCNLQHCGSIWECPGCMLTIKARRAEEVTHVVESHGRERAVMLTLTVAHGWADDLERLRRDLADAWSGFIRGAPWERIRAELGIEGFIRAHEVTHGKNGWHPHLHVVVLLRDPIPQSEVLELADGAEWMPAVRARLIARWREMVRKFCGAEHEPDDVHGLSLSPIHRVDYLSKLGLELTDVSIAKRGKCGSRSPLEILWDYCSHKNKRDAELWRGYCRAMRGARQLTWSRGLKRKHGIRDRSDLEIAECEDPGPGDRIIGSVPAIAWRQIRLLELDHNGTPASAASWILDRAEAAGPEGLRDALLHVLCGHATTLPEPVEGADRRAYETWVAGLVRPSPVQT